MAIGTVSGDSDRFPRRLVWIVAGVGVLAHALAMVLPRGVLWGADAFAFLPPFVFFLSTIACAIVGMMWMRLEATPSTPSPETSPENGRSDWGWLVAPAMAAAALPCLWLLRARHILLGDGIAITSSLSESQPIHPLEPLSGWMQHAVHDLVKPLLDGPAREPYAIAWLSAAMLSVAAGAVFVPVLWALAKRLADTIGGEDQGPRRRRARVLVFSVLALQGYLQLFFGYVEVYALSTLAIAIYLLASLRVLRNCASLWTAALALALALSLHLSALVLLPSFIVLLAVRIRERSRRPLLARDLTLTVTMLAGSVLVLALLGRGYNLGATSVSIVRTVLVAQPEAFPHYFFSWRHLRDFLNEQLLIGPLALLLFAPLAIAAVRARRRWNFLTAFLVAFGAGFVIACVLAGDSNLGYARNWDLLAPAGFALTAAGLALLLPRFRSTALAMPCLVVALIVSGYHTLPWIGLNASLPRSLARFETLPLDLGRVESTLGYWYELRNDTAEAERWFVRALEKNSANVRAHVFLGRIYSGRGEFRQAGRAFRYATDLRPERDDYRLQLVDALVNAGDPASAIPEVERVLGHETKDPRIWSLYGIVLLGAGRTDAARQAFATARSVAPGLWFYRVLTHYADLPNGYHRALDDVWKALIGA